jgi:hypothetical protein
MFNDEDIEIRLTKLQSGLRLIRVTHIATGIYVEDSGDPAIDESIVRRTNELKQALESKVKNSRST